MKSLFFLSLILCLVAPYAFAESGSIERLSVVGFYGLGFISPSDINGIAASQGTTPKLNSLSSGTFYGGGLGVMVSSRFQLRGTFELQDSKNGVTTSAPFSASGAGFELLQNEIWGSANYFLFHSAKVFGYLGASLGYPTYSHVTSTLSAKTEYDADKTLGYRGQLGFGVFLGRHLAVSVEGGYQYLISGNIKASSGTTLTLANGSNAKMDLSGMRVQGGLEFLF